MPLASARFVGSTKALLSVSAIAMPPALPLIAVEKALAMLATLPSVSPVHCGSGRPSRLAASARPVLLGLKKEFVVTWLMKPNFQAGVLGKFPVPLPAPELLCAPVQSA